MSGLYKAFKTDSKAEQSGAPVAFPDAANSDGTIPTFYVRHNGSKYTTQYHSAIDAAYKPFKRRVESGDEDAKLKWIEKTNDLFCDYVISGWENVLDENDQPLEFTKENVRSLMRALPVLLGRLVSASVEFDRFREEDLKDDTKN